MKKLDRDFWEKLKSEAKVRRRRYVEDLSDWSSLYHIRIDDYDIVIDPMGDWGAWVRKVTNNGVEDLGSVPFEEAIELFNSKGVNELREKIDWLKEHEEDIRKLYQQGIPSPAVIGWDEDGSIVLKLMLPNKTLWLIPTEDVDEEDNFVIVNEDNVQILETPEWLVDSFIRLIDNVIDWYERHKADRRSALNEENFEG
jgi:hypothetical protein